VLKLNFIPAKDIYIDLDIDEYLNVSPMRVQDKYYALHATVNGRVSMFTKFRILTKRRMQSVSYKKKKNI